MYLAATEYNSIIHSPFWFRLVFAGWILGCLLNAGYLLWHPKQEKSRILWLDAKERQLRERAQKDK